MEILLQGEGGGGWIEKSLFCVIILSERPHKERPKAMKTKTLQIKCFQVNSQL